MYYRLLSTHASLPILLSRIVKPDYVLVRQRTKDRLDHFKNIVIGLNYGLLPMLENVDLWHIFQDKSWTFSHLSQIQQRLGRDKFPLINQIYCQSHLELVSIMCDIKYYYEYKYISSYILNKIIPSSSSILFFYIFI